MNNRAGYGGGLLARGDEGNLSHRLQVNIGDDVVIGDNIADRNGGGIHVSGFTQLTMNGVQVALHRNRALGVLNNNNYEDGQGGGLYVKLRADATIRAAPFGIYPVFWLNEARYGGAIVATGDASISGSNSVKISSHPSGEPMMLGDNRASVAGGAIYLGAGDAAVLAPNPSFAPTTPFSETTSRPKARLSTLRAIRPPSATTRKARSSSMASAMAATATIGAALPALIAAPSSAIAPSPAAALAPTAASSNFPAGPGNSSCNALG